MRNTAMLFFIFRLNKRQRLIQAIFQINQAVQKEYHLRQASECFLFFQPRMLQAAVHDAVLIRLNRNYGLPAAAWKHPSLKRHTITTFSVFSVRRGRPLPLPAHRVSVGLPASFCRRRTPLCI